MRRQVTALLCKQSAYMEITAHLDPEVRLQLPRPMPAFYLLYWLKHLMRQQAAHVLLQSLQGSSGEHGRGKLQATWLEIPVEVALLVDVGQALEDCGAPLPHQLLRQQPLACLHKLVQVALLQVPWARVSSARAPCQATFPRTS